MNFEITKACADSLRTFIQNNYGIQLKSSHAHELVAAYFGYSSRAALIADKQCPIGNLKDAELIILNYPAQKIKQRLETLANLPSGLPPIDIIAETVYKAIADNEQLSENVWNDLEEMAKYYAEDRVFHNEKMMRMMGIDYGFDQRDLDWLIKVDIKTMEANVILTVTYDYPAKAKKADEARISIGQASTNRGNIGYGQPDVLPTFYAGHMSDPDYRLTHGID